VADWPAATDWVPEPETVTVKSKPMPLSGTVTLVASVEVVTEREPDCAPPSVGANSTPAVQLKPGPSAAAQVLLTSWKPAGTARVRLLKVVMVPVLVTVTVVGLLARPTPVVGNLMVAGATWMATAAAPVPLSDTVAVLAMVEDVTVSEPVATPVAVGVKTTPTVQVEPAARLAGQVFCARANPAVTASESALAGALLVLLTVTVCAALVEPTMVGTKVSWEGLTLSPEGTVDEPERRTVTGVTPAVDEVMVSAAELAPATTGVKTTCTVQLEYPARVAPQVVAPVEKLAAAAPVIWKPTFAAGTAPLLVMVRLKGALATPTVWLGKLRLVGLTDKAAG